MDADHTGHGELQYGPAYFFFFADRDSAAVRFFFGLPFPLNFAI